MRAPHEFDERAGALHSCCCKATCKSSNKPCLHFHLLQQVRFQDEHRKVSVTLNTLLEMVEIHNADAELHEFRKFLEGRKV
jgi:hypothetical protein